MIKFELEPNVPVLQNCGVVSTAVAAGLPYADTWLFYKRRHHKGSNWKGYMFTEDVINGMRDLGVKLKDLYFDDRDRRPHLLRDFVENVAKKMPDKVFFVHVTKHFCLVQGERILDQRGPIRSQIHWARRKLVKRVFEIVENNPDIAVAKAAEMSDVIVTNKTRSNPMSKIEQAKNLYAQNSTLSRKEMIELFVKELQIPATTASTYQAVAKKAFTNAPKVEQPSGSAGPVANNAIATNLRAPKPKYNEPAIADTSWMGIKDLNLDTWPAELAAEVAELEAWDANHKK